MAVLSAYALSANPVPANRRPVAFETISRTLCASGSATSSGRRYLCFFTAYDPRPFTSLELYTGAGAPGTITAARMGLYSVDASGNCSLVAQTANDATIAAAASTAYNRALATAGGYPASYSLTPGGVYAASFYATTGGSAPTLFAFATGGGTGPSVVGVLPHVVGFDNSGSGTDLNTAVTAANVSLVATVYYMAGV